MKLFTIGLQIILILTLSSVSFLLFAPFADAGDKNFSDGRKLLEVCNITEKAMDQNVPMENIYKHSALDIGYCFGYVEGIVGLNSIYKPFRREIAFCPPAGYTNEQGVRILTKYLRQHPEALHQRGIGLAWYAFREAFPCKSQP